MLGCYSNFQLPDQSPDNSQANVMFIAYDWRVSEHDQHLD